MSKTIVVNRALTRMKNLRDSGKAPERCAVENTIAVPLGGIAFVPGTSIPVAAVETVNLAPRQGRTVTTLPPQQPTVAYLAALEPGDRA